MKTSKDVLSALGGLISGHMAREQKSPFMASISSGNSLDVTVRDSDGSQRLFGIIAVELDPQTGKPIQHNQEGCDNQGSSEGTMAAHTTTQLGEAGCCGGDCDTKEAAPAAE